MTLSKYKFILIILCSLLTVHCSLQSQSLQQIESSRILLPNGWSLTPVGKSLKLGDLPLNIAVSRSKKLLAVTNNGESTQSIQLIDAINDKIADSITVGKSWYGLAFSDDEKELYASGGNDNFIIRFSIKNNKLYPKDTLIIDKPWPERVSPTGIAVDDKKHVLYTVTKENNSLYTIDIKTKKVIKRFDLGSEGYSCILSSNRNILYVSCWGNKQIRIYNTKEMAFTGEIEVGDHPNDMCLSKDGKYLFAANSNDNSVSVIDIAKRKEIETLNAALYPDAPSGSTTNSVALSEDGKTLYIANADNYCLAVFDVSNPDDAKSKGFIPTGWYPTCVRVVNGKLYIANGKGFNSMANPYGPNPTSKKENVNYQEGDMEKPKKIQYIAGLFKGTMSIINEPDAKQLGIYSQAVYNNIPYNKDKEKITEGEKGNPVPMKSGESSPIKYVFYIIKENRTYDQVLGDIPEGNGDNKLVLFGENITPNQHSLSKQFVLLDNFYVDGEVSADGHEWSMGAYATDYLEKTWPTSYGGRGGDYDSEGNRPIANNKMGYLWDFCNRAGVSYRTYGEFINNNKPNIPVLKDHYCKHYTGWDLNIYDTTRFEQWKKDFDSLLSIGKLPQLNTLRFPNDHTEGMRKNALSPFAHVADNDRAVGLFVEYLSKSPVWNESIVFILEDDAQDGPDHIDAHRSTAYLAGGFVKRGFIDHTMYSTSSMLRTIEMILGLPPMSQYDAAAKPMWRCFNDSVNNKAFNSIKPKVSLYDRNTAMNKLQKLSDEQNFTMEDRVPDELFNEILWYSIKGENNVYPPVHHAAFFKELTTEN